MAGRIAQEMLEALARAVLALTIVAGSGFVWIGVPVGALWLGGRITTEPDRFLLFALCSIPTAMVVFGWLLYRVNRVYEGLRSRAGLRPDRLLEVAMVASAWTAVVLMAIWFFLFAELRLVTF